ncbi:GTP cyclohydrolase I FolE2 [Catenovulum sp. SM1970]|nr:GTP cyclohydrolase I FolE2 [Marinifaba aquimaris]
MANLPDITSSTASDSPLKLQWVGMEKIAVPLTLAGQHLASNRISAMADVFVSLEDEKAKGIHMSRLYFLLNEHLAGSELSVDTLTQLMQALITSQAGLSQAAKLNLRFDLMLNKPALLSDNFGYQAYPVEVCLEYQNDTLAVELNLDIPYSSTCPCSASLSRQLYKEAVDEQFSTDTIDKAQLLDWIASKAGSVATPHSQRSHAYIKLQLGTELPDIASLIFAFEEVIATPVQTAVKREDEQAFARLNAQNLMFCEDAARKLKTYLAKMQAVQAYWFKVEHQESLHAHNAVVIESSF